MESLNHKILINITIDFIKEELDIQASFLQIDNGENKARPQQMTKGFIPDIYYEYLNKLVIGEAKTSKDFNRSHSMEQYEAYMKKCHLYEGKAVFVLAVPWTEFISAKKIIRKIKEQNQYKFKCFIISDFKIKEEL